MVTRSACNLEQGGVPGKKKEGTAGGVSGSGSFFLTRRGAWCLVFGKEDRRFWRGSLVSGERRRLVKRRSCWFCFKRMEPVLGAEKKTERKGVSVVPDACSTPREEVYT